MSEAKLWNIPEEALKGLTPEKLRDLIIECFYHAQKESIAHAKEKLGKTPTDEEVRKSAINMVKLIFDRVNCDYNRPHKEGICKAVEELASMAKAWGTPDFIVEHHKKQILEACNLL